MTVLTVMMICENNQLHSTMMHMDVMQILAVFTARVCYVHSGSFTFHRVRSSESTVRCELH